MRAEEHAARYRDYHYRFCYGVIAKLVTPGDKNRKFYMTTILGMLKATHFDVGPWACLKIYLLSFSCLEERLLAMRLSPIALSLGMALFPIGTVSAQDQPASAKPQQQLLDAAQLDQLVAPIALYPDPLVAQVLMASTYPLEVVQADRFAKDNKKLKGEKLKEALDKQDWDASVKELVSTPTVLAMMSDKLDWTQNLAMLCLPNRQM